MFEVAFELNKRVFRDAKKRFLLANIADTPELCDFYMGGIVNKGHVKIAIFGPKMAKWALEPFF